jgi:hypothetical protein
MSIEYFVYIWTNTRNGKKYIGSHKGKKDYGYIGSGIYFKRAYNKEPENFRRDILETYNSYEEMREGEKYYLTKFCAMEDRMFYNLTNLSGGGNLHAHLSDEQKKDLHERGTKLRLIKLANMTTEEKENLKLKKQIGWEKNGNKLRHSEKTRERRLMEEKNKTLEDRKKFSEKCKNSYWSRSEEKREKENQKKSSSVKLSYNNIPGLREARTEHLKTVNKGKIYINKNGKTKFIYPSDLEKFLNDGWIKGRGSFKKK